LIRFEKVPIISSSSGVWEWTLSSNVLMHWVEFERSIVLSLFPAQKARFNALNQNKDVCVDVVIIVVKWITFLYVCVRISNRRVVVFYISQHRIKRVLSKPLKCTNNQITADFSCTFLFQIKINTANVFSHRYGDRSWPYSDFLSICSISKRLKSSVYTSFNLIFTFKHITCFW
jgi:hypothetical protein